VVNKPFILIPIILLLIALSGCIHILTTAERQACLSATHASTNSITECKTQNECYNKLTEKTTISTKLPISIYNNNVIYFNNVASATHNFNKSKNDLEKLNESCNVEDVDEIIDSANDFFLYLRNIFSFIDKSNQTSIILLKDYAIYLESQGINKIPEEDIFLDYVIINENLNELKISSNNENYISDLLIKSKELNNIAKDFGFKKDYISNVNYLDLTTYYLKLIDSPSGNLKVPTISPGINYMISELSNIEQLKNITKNLQRANSYNLYVTLDKSIGSTNSLYSGFREINESININLDKIYEQIDEKEIEIEKNKTYISKKTQYQYTESYVRFRNKEIGFGDYLAQLKFIDLEIETNKITEEDQNIELKIGQIKCDEIIFNAKRINNSYINNLITRYEISDNYQNKKEYCEQINKATKTTSCKLELAKVLDLREESINKLNIEFNENLSEIECINKINNINQILENNTEIKLLKDIVKDNKNIIVEIKQQNEWMEYEDKYIVEEINELTNVLDTKPNYELIINLNEEINKQQTNNRTLLSICARIEEKYLIKNHKIEFAAGEYYLIIFNLFSKSLNEIKIQIPELGSISKAELYPGTNYIKISYENKKTITKSILKLGLDKTLFEIIIKNTVTGIYDQIFIDKTATLISGAESDGNGNARYFSEIENRILFYQYMLDSTHTNTELLDIGAGYYKIINEINIKNKYDKEINGQLELQETSDNEINVIKENNQIIPFEIINSYLSVQLKLGLEEETTYQIQTLKDKKEIIQIAKEAQNNAKILIASRFKNISDIANQELGKYAIQEINENTTLEVFSNALLLNTKIIELQAQEKECLNLENEYFLIYTSI